jgi:glutamyl-tRNA synthetase
MGYLPEALLNFLVRLGWSHGDQEIFSFEEMLNLFNPKDINKSASIYNTEKLDWLNAHYIKNSSNEKLAKLLEDYDLVLSSHDKKEILLDAIKERCKTLVDMVSQIKEILDRPLSYDAKAVKKAFKGEAKEILQDFKERLQNSQELHLPIDYHNIIEAVVNEREIGFGKIGQPLRVALLGKMGGPGIDTVMSVISKQESIIRIENALKNI